MARALVLRVEQGLRIQCVWLRWARRAAGASVPKAAGGTVQPGRPQRHGIRNTGEYGSSALTYQALSDITSGSINPSSLLVPCQPVGWVERSETQQRLRWPLGYAALSQPTDCKAFAVSSLFYFRTSTVVIPAKAGIHALRTCVVWIPAFARMTKSRSFRSESGVSPPPPPARR